MNTKSIIFSLLALLLISMAPVAYAQDEANGDAVTQENQDQGSEAADLDALLDMVQQGVFAETEEHRQREAEFLANRDRQAQLLRQARRTKADEENISERLERTFQNNEDEIANLQQRLQDRLGSLNELFGVLQQVAGDARGIFEGSLISIQFPDRNVVLDTLIEKAAGGTDLPSIAEIEGLWFELQREMTESGKIVKFPHTVWTFDGNTQTVDLIRVGDFNLIANGKYYNYLAGTGRVSELVRQPAGRFTDTAEDLGETSSDNFTTFGIDPSRGQLLSLLVLAPSMRERIEQGREVGYLIILMGFVGLGFVIERIVYLSLVTRRIKKQIRAGAANINNPLGRVLRVYEENKSVDVETLELKLDEAILKETPALERFLTIIKIISAVAPLFGLLGTVTGMIATFQAITLFGTGDPKLMADGISQALVTTVLGLVVAIPTLLMHSFVAGMSKRIIHILEEQSAGIIAVHAEKAAANV